MTKNRTLVTITVLFVVVLLMSHEVSTWRAFDWAVFYANVRQISVARTLAAVALMYGSFWLRALRWSVLLRRVKKVPAIHLLSPTIVGFTGLALLGRPGELIRPYLIGRKQGVSISSQMAVLTVERIFDMGAAGVLVVTTLFSSSQLQVLPYVAQFRRGGSVLITLVAAFAAVTLLLANYGEKLALLLTRILSPLSHMLAHRAAELTSVFSGDLSLITSAKSLAYIVVLSIAIWFLIAFAHLENLHAFIGLRHLSLAEAVLLLGFSLLGSLAQLPGGGSQQLIVVAALIHVFGVSPELAVSCTTLGWIAIFMAPVPAGIALLRHERLSLQSFHSAPGATRQCQSAEP